MQIGSTEVQLAKIGSNERPESGAQPVGSKPVCKTQAPASVPAKLTLDYMLADDDEMYTSDEESSAEIASGKSDTLAKKSPEKRQKVEKSPEKRSLNTEDKENELPGPFALRVNLESPSQATRSNVIAQVQSKVRI